MDCELIIEKAASTLLRQAATRLPVDVKEALRRAYEIEDNPIGKLQLRNILENVRLAEENNLPLCQDTGVISFYLKAGSNFRGLGKIENALRRAVRKSTAEIPLRPNSVDFFTNINSGDNTGRHIPYIHWEIFDGDYLEITVLLKGGGSENACVLKMMNPSEGLNGLKKFVIDSVLKAGGTTCPPTIIGIGVGGGSDIAMTLAKKAILKPINEENPDEKIAKIERELYNAINMTGIGPMGLGGKITTLAVKIEHAHRHPASYPVAVAFQCWAARKASARIYSNGQVEYLTHKI
ncbi:fumarate hydratase [Candidatus Bathyarchaeota archaeon]|nr:fumarate hydratase [Candidatus Bathyarchaeota archaeon]